MSKDTVESNASVFSRETIIRSVITIAVLVALYLLVRRLSGVLLPFLISFVVAYMLAPIVNFFQHKCRLKNRVLSIVVTLLLVIGLLTGAVAAVVPAISRQATSLSQSIKTYVSQWDGNEYFSPRVNERIEEIIQSIDIKTLINSEEVQQGIKKVIPILGDWISSGVNAIMGLAVAFICILYIIFLLIDYEKISTNWHKYIPNRFRDSIVMLMGDLDRNMNAYFRGQALVAGIVGILFAIGFQIIGLPMGIGIGLFIGVLNLVPYLQALGIPPCIILGLIQSAETGRPVWVVMLCVAAVFIIVQTIQDMVLVPTIMGNVTGMGPAWILLSLSVWGSLLGFVGMIIALPVTTLLVSYYKRFVLHISDDMTKPLPRSSWNIPFLKNRKIKK
ncbi:MAG: AI-2E family transporter [Paludibacteraceae bacterium]|nr:AI-2E family transporter [Paludibacteraceae bacterium]